MAKRDYYEILGISKSADDNEIKKAYRTLAKQFHPDLNQGDNAAEAKFKEINEAYKVLSDPNARASYDQYGHEGLEGGGFDFSGGFGGIEDIFDMFFGGGMGGNRRRVPKRGADLQYNLKISFEEAAFGCTKTIDINRWENCPDCGGTGSKQGTFPEECPECHGSGQVDHVQQTPFGMFRNRTTCTRCNGEGTVIKEICQACNGKKHVRRNRKITVKIPAGIDTGQAITLRGEGHPGEMEGPNGDLYVRIAVDNHTIFNRKGYDIYCDVPITFTQASLGSELEVPTLDGRMKFSIAEGTQTGHTFRLRNHGIQRLKSNTRGDQYVTVNVEIPRRLSDKQRELLIEFEEISTAVTTSIPSFEPPIDKIPVPHPISSMV